MATVASGLNSGSGFNSSDTITSTTLNNHVNDATVTNILTADIASSSNKTTGVTFEKMQHISTEKVLGRTSSNEGDVEEIDIAGASGILLDEDTMSSDSATRGATQQSIKAYVDAITQKEALFHYIGASVTVLNTDNSTFSKCPLTQSYNFITGVSISSNEITLPAGDYLVDGVANIAITNNNQNNGAVNLIEKTDGTGLLRGMDVSTDNDFSTNSTRNTRIIGRLNLSQSTVIRWMFKRQGSGNTYNVTLGRNYNGSDSDVPHAYLKITKLGL